MPAARNRTSKATKVCEFLSWDPDTEEARVAILRRPGAAPDGLNGYVAIVVVRDEQDAREMVRRWNQCNPARDQNREPN